MQLASALKLWLSCLPQPLLPADMGNILLQATVYCQGGERLHLLQQVFNHVRLRNASTVYNMVQMLTVPSAMQFRIFRVSING